MPSDYARRGRPRGSGLDDRAQLRRIVEMLEADPGLKPTTAIKAMGVSDPSTIRRLRDKLRAAAPAHGARTGSGRGPGMQPAVQREARHCRKEPVSPERVDVPGAGLAEAVPAPDADVSALWFTRWCAFGLSALSSTVSAQVAALDDFVQMPHVASALRQQILFNEVAKAFCPTRTDVRSPTLH